MTRQPVLLLTLLATLAPAQTPSVVARKTPTLTIGGLTFKDLNRNGKLDKYEDWRLPIETRIADLINQMTLAEKAGLMIHSSLQGFTGPNGIVLDAPPPPRPGAGPGFSIPPHAGVTPLDRPAPSDLVLKRNVRWILVRPANGEAPAITARFHNGLQEIAESSRLGIPIVFSSDPRHSPTRMPIGPAVTTVATISQWPEQLGFGAIRDPEVVREFGRIAAQEYRALGLHCVLGPMADVATEPRWNRIPGTFGEDAELNAKLVKAYVEGFQGPRLTPASVLTVTKHWPGDGPVKDGLDPHNDYGKYQVYPGNNFDHHLIPFKAAFEAHTAGIMPGYAIPVGIDDVAMNFSKKIVRDLLRGTYHYDGLVVTDWLRNMPWGVENLSEKERQKLMVEAGIDQIGGDNDPKYILELVSDGAISEARLNESARRILKPMFELGLFENPYVDPNRAAAIVGSADFSAKGNEAQRRSIVLLKNANQLLPLPANRKFYIENLDKTIAANYGTVVDDLEHADAAIIKVTAPYALHPNGTGFARMAKEGTLAYAGAENARELEAIERLAKSGKPVIVCVYLDRPAIMTEFINDVAAVLGHFSSTDPAILDIIFGRAAPTGKLPINLPRDMESVKAQLPDVPNDLKNPLFKFGFGLTYGSKSTVPLASKGEL